MSLPPKFSPMVNSTFNFQQALPKDSIGSINTASDSFQESVLLSNQLGLLTPTTVAGTFYGVAFALYYLYVHSLAPRLRSRDTRRRDILMLAHSTIVMLCGLASLITNGWVTQDAYVNHGNNPGGPYQYTSSICHSLPVIAIGLTCQMLVDILTSAIQVWRVWVILSTTSYGKLLTVLPFLCFLAFTVLQLRTVIIGTTLPMEVAEKLDTKTTRAAEVAIQGVTTMLCTALISLYLIRVRWQHRKLIGGAITVAYLNIVAMLVESYAMESIWLFIVTLYVCFPFPVGILFGETKTYIEIIAYLLVLCRVANGKAYESQRGYDLSSMHWNGSKHHTMSFGDTSGTGDVPLGWSLKSSTEISPTSMA
ncbi:hypothetical protein AGABI1DRAFT_127302 [Agaricus bisporus var. burnettii JB137-S8]|uniref:Uncharacterized protein n=1 Tax=Agaricus bisporus var. burnettii (strain JB137-S8 / ATCC MYA-4627 / FGSC 10392) TaxID=597362 RepID=K5Y0K2_AGABU|nr:uncharacterized protein AGABI1DRAFT_127302 [Agaricus bisporus var. burnettii JB137-S8]EKM81290.1 hypothetical protein AGABI1DRAFT_127302 [Agaricus bisporus var. burnettii JB137-S8]